MFRIALTLFFVAGGLPLSAQNVEAQLKRVAYNANFAVLSMWHNTMGDRPDMLVIGTGFLVTPDGYFITAAHVLQEYKPKTAQMTAGLRQRSGDGGGV